MGNQVSCFLDFLRALFGVCYDLQGVLFSGHRRVQVGLGVNPQWQSCGPGGDAWDCLL